MDDEIFVGYLVRESYAVMTTLFSIDNGVRNQNGNAINFMVDVEFLSLRQMLDTLYRRLHTQRKAAP